MNRNRKHVVRQHQKRIQMVRSEDMMSVLLMRMAETGPKLIEGLRTATQASHGGAYQPGHVLDVMIKASAAMEKAALNRDAKAWIEAAADVLFLARDIAVSQGEIVVAVPTQKAD